ncbi:MAG: molecular chaperone HtpG [bacterium]|nr:molecular chaperone HtpG [bacterium]
MAKTCAFKAEIRQMLDLVIHSLYSKKEIFLRELISNASDAIDRAKYLALTDKSIAPEAPEWKILLTADSETHTLVIEDNGVGMSAEEMEDALGTIAKSGSKAFAEALKKGEETNIPELIGKFGVGFYAAFMVADCVTVDSLRRGEGSSAVRWMSTGDGEYTMDEGARTTPGTTISLHLREGMDDYTSGWTLRDLVRRYSDFIAYPIHLVEVGKKEEAKQPDEDKPLNTMVALWKRAKSDVKPEEYEAFYRQTLHGAGEPMRSLHIVTEGTLEYRALIFIPKSVGMEMMMPGKKHGLSLYVRNVFIGDEVEELVPSWLRFIKGVVDSSDLPLNVSREMLQDDAIIRKIRNDVTNRVLKALAEMAKEKPEDYVTFTAALGDFLKEGYHSDWEHREKLQELLRFRNLKDEAYTSLKAYKEAMPEGQKAIYMLTADTLQAAKHSPCLEALKAKGYDVLFLTTPVDQFIAAEFYEYDKTPIVFADKGDLKLEDDEAAAKEKQEAAEKEYKALTESITKQLEATVREVRVSTRLTDSACCLVQDPQALNPAMRRMMEAMGQSVPEEKRILEINPTHPLIQTLAQTTDETKCADTIDLLYGQACLAEGSLPPDPVRFNALVAALMQ